jgi:hypothetical protein
MAMVNKTNALEEVKDPYPDIQARPLSLPDFINVKAKNPNISLRWVNRAVGLAGSTQRLDEMVYAGFEPATPVDVCMANGQPIMNNLIKDGKIIRGDLMLMKISRQAYEGALKYNWERAVQRLHPGKQLATGQSQLNKAVAERGVPRNVLPTIKSKLQAFRPGTDEKTADPHFMDGDDLKLGSERKED